MPPGPNPGHFLGHNDADFASRAAAKGAILTASLAAGRHPEPKVVAPPDHVVRGINCPVYGNGGIRAKVAAAIEWMDRNGHENFGHLVAIDRSALIMLREEFENLQAQVDRLQGRLRTVAVDPATPGGDYTVIGLIEPKSPVPEACNPPINSASWCDRMFEHLPDGTAIRVEAGEFVLTVPR